MSIMGLRLFLWFVCYVSSMGIMLCPVSTMPNFTGNHDFLYPIEIYHSDRIKDGVPVDPFVKCAIGIDGLKNFSCPLQSLGCPIVEDNVLTGGAVSSEWRKATSMCTLKSAIKKPGTSVNVIAFGGSVTLGCATTWCCPHAECSIRESPRCAWPHYLEPWLQSFGNKNVKVINFGRGGTTSFTSSELLQEYMDRVKLDKLSRNDLIFIDHSFNDNYMSSLPAKSQLERGLEKLIRRLLTFTPGEIPTIILIESDTRIHSKSYYPKIYRALANHYGLRIYSFMEATQSALSIQQQEKYHHHLTHKYRKDNHPAWHTHLIYADFLSSILLREMSECDTTYRQDGSAAAAAAEYVLPESMFNISDHEHCNKKFAPLLRVSYDDIEQGTMIGSYSMPSNGTWQLRKDRKGRGGFIAELNATDDFALLQDSPLWFTLNITVGELKKMYHRSSFYMQLSYLKSYFNAGIANLIVCGEIFDGAVDTLWNDWTSYHYTTTEIFTWKLEKCEQRDDEYVQIGFQHSIDFTVERQPRTRQQIKINSVVVCRYNN